MKSDNSISFAIGVVCAILAFAALVWLDIPVLKEIVVGVFAALSFSAFLYSPPSSDDPWGKLLFSTIRDVSTSVTVVSTLGDRTISVQGTPTDYFSKGGRLARLVLENAWIGESAMPDLPYGHEPVADRVVVDLSPQATSIITIRYRHTGD
jgi:hypothetical protein